MKTKGEKTEERVCQRCEDRPASGDKELTDHIRKCDKHPMKRISDEHAMLRKALIGLVGAESREDLEQIEAAIREMPVPYIDRMNAMNAIQALLQTSSETPVD